MTKYEVGDEVTLKGRISGHRDRAGGLHIELCVGGDPKVILPAHIWAFPDAFLTHTPKPRELKVGDMVRRVNFAVGGYELVAIRNGYGILWHARDKFSSSELLDDIEHE